MDKINPVIDSTWLEVLKPQFELPYFQSMKQRLLEEKGKYSVYPPGNLIFAAFNLTPFNKVKVVILGQDPYHGEGQANGLCFSVSQGIPKPPSLENIFKEIKNDLGYEVPVYGNLEHWAKQGVLLLNASLTVRAHTANSHQHIGWQMFTDAAIQQISANKFGVVFMLWGKFAQSKEKLIDVSKHLVLKAAHPSPFSAYNGFFGCRHFSLSNTYLTDNGNEPIDWKVI